MRAPASLTLIACLAVAAAACGKKPAGDSTTAPITRTPDPVLEQPPPRAHIVRVTLVSAEIAGTMPNGGQWDTKKNPIVNGVDSQLTRYLEQHPELELTADKLGVPVGAENLAKGARKSPAADPMVLVTIDGTVYRSTVRPGAFSPTWEFPFEFSYGVINGKQRVAGDASVQIQVVDFDAPDAYDTIGSTLISVDDLLSKSTHKLGPFGSVRSLTLQVAKKDPPAAGAAPLSKRLAVRGDSRWTDTGIRIAAGQHVDIRAADQVCSKKADVDKYCKGPEGQAAKSSYNLPGFAGVGHAALVGVIGDTRFPVQRGKRFVAPSSGVLRLGINDTDVTDNSGAFEVTVRVSAP